MADLSTDFIPCMLIPLQQHYLLLPNTTIAEVIPMPRLVAAEDKPHFYLGHYQWQMQPISVVNLETIVDDQHQADEQANKLCIIHSINPESKLSAYALPCHGAPQLIHLNESALKLVDEANELSDYLHCRTHIGNKIAYIPDLDKLEQLISNHR